MSTGEWESEKIVLEKFYSMFDERIKYLFMVDKEQEDD
jgi:hypothetical protein